MKPLARHNAREYALQALYQWQISEAPLQDIEMEFLSEHITQELDLDYFKELIHTIPSVIDELDAAMTPFLHRSIKELDPVELAVLRIGIYELAKRPDIHHRIIINEALEMTKKFGSIDGYKFVNGILDKVTRELRSLEINSDKKSSS